MQINITHVERHFMDFQIQSYECLAFKSPVYVHLNSGIGPEEHPNSMVVGNNIGLKGINLLTRHVDCHQSIILRLQICRHILLLNIVIHL